MKKIGGTSKGKNVSPVKGRSKKIKTTGVPESVFGVDDSTPEKHPGTQKVQKARAMESALAGKSF